MIGSSKVPLALDDTIVARSSAAGPGLRAVIRLSGPDAVRIARSLLLNAAFDQRVRQAVAGGIVLPGFVSPLPADAILFRAPKTYTGQDVVELHTISSPPLIDVLLAELLRAGARAAGPGEFTMRGFLAGKLDLTRAEAVHAVIAADRPDDLTRALGQLAGNLARPLDAVRDDLLNLLADVEAGLDFSEEDLEFASQQQILGRIAKALAQVTLALKQMDERSTSGPMFRVVLAGPPNAGKSTLFNALLGRDAALVSPMPATTRDYLEADLRIGDAALRLIDTAGLGDAAGEIDAAAQGRSRELLEAADLVVWCQDCREPASSLERFTVRTKGDLDPSRADAVSVLTGHGLAELKEKLAERARDHANPLAPSLSRCRHHALACLEHLRRTHRQTLDGEPAELLALDLRLALDELGAIVGAVYTDDLLDRVFSRFCIGK